MVLDNISEGPGLFVELCPAFDPKIFCHGNLHVFNPVSVPQGLKDGICKAED